MISPENKAKLHELIKGTNITESMIETAYENGALEGEEKSFIKTTLQAFDNGIDIDLIVKITQRNAIEVRAVLIEFGRIK
ncbi:MAG: hypothetical protein Q8J69_09690 [Sphingobacteriaceae bacterium]|nr:hypothetical protein [Sphingobacteriaceae bacterium]